MVVRPPCARCGRTSTYEDNGLTYCAAGHLQEDGPVVGEDEGDYGNAGKTTRIRNVREKQKISKVYRGSKGYRLFIQAWQFILWKQCHNLVHDKGMPDDLWLLVRELWSLRLSRLADQLEHSTETDAEETGGLASDSATETEHERSTTGSIRPARNSPTLPDTVALTYIGVLLMRRPLSLATIYRYIRREEICYIRAIRHVPEAIRDHLAPEYYAALDTTIIPTQQSLQLAILRAVTLYSTSFGMTIPPINWTLLLFQFLQELGLPLEIFPVVKYLKEMTKSDFTYPSSLSARKTPTTLPEAQLIGLFVVATKLLFPFDNDSTRRYPHSVNEPAAVQIDWTSWMLARNTNTHGDTNEAKTKSESIIEPEKAIEITDRDIMSMDNDQLDQYMDWFQQTYTTKRENDGLRGEINNMFPLDDVPDRIHADATSKLQAESAMLGRLRGTQLTLQSRRAIPDEEVDADNTVLRPGERYQRFHSVDALTGPALTFHQEAAELACLDVESLVRAVLSIESSLLLHQQEVRRAQLFSRDVVTP